MTKRRAAPLRAPLEIERLAPGGAGLAFLDVEGERRAVFVRAAAPGDRVEAEIDLATRPARARILAVVAAGPGRVAPACAAVDRCGGCDWMHLDPDTQRRAHAEIVGAALPARWRDVAVLSHAAPRPLGYRGRARLHVRAGRGRASVGMFEVETRDPVEVDACVALVPELDRARARLGPLLEGCRGRGEAQIALGPFDDDPRRPVLELRWDGELAPAVFARLEEGVLRGQWKGARVWSGEVRVPAVVGSPAPWILGGDGEPLALAPGGFAQASDEGNALLAGRVAALAEVGRGGRALELHAGSGNLTVVLARVAPGMTAVESSPDACAAARANLGRRGLDARVVEADAAEHLRARAAGPRLDLVVLDPPRTGARAVAEALAKTPARHVLYVSCDPQTLGRDLAILGERYTPRAVESVEMFPQTSHVESIVLLEKKRP